MLNQRQQSILSALVQGYVRTARPMASRDLACLLDDPVSSATVRNELARLDELGYADQPHTSAGRVPTGKGYRFFVDHLMRKHCLLPQEERAIRMLERVSPHDEFLSALANTVAEWCGSFTATGMVQERRMHKVGLTKILEEPEFETRNRVQSFAHLVDLLDEELYDFLDGRDDQNELVFIGRENPFPEAREYTMMVSWWRHPGGFEGFLTMISPTRMNYEHHLSFLDLLHRHFSKGADAEEE